MQMHTFDFGESSLLLHEASAYEFLSLRERLPMGVLHMAMDERTQFGVVMKCEEAEVLLVRVDSGPVEREDREAMTYVVSGLIAAAIPAYLERGFEGLLMPMVYADPKGGSDLGLACLVAPAPDGPETRGHSRQEDIDEVLGRGAAAMAWGFLTDFAQLWTEEFGKKLPLLGFDIRPRLSLGTIGFGFAVNDTDVLYLGRYPEEAAPALESLAAGGIESVGWLPSVPTEIRAEDLVHATGPRH